MKEKSFCFLKYMLLPCAVLAFIVIAGKFMRPIAMDTYVKQIETFHQLPENSIDVLVYGSSHAWLGVNTKEMYDKYGIEAYNYGCSWQHLNTTSLFFYDSLRTQSPKVVLIETFIINEILENVDADPEIGYTRSISDFDYKKQYLSQCFGKNYKRYITYYFPFVEYHSNWENLTKDNFTFNSCAEDFMDSRGYRNTMLNSIVSVEPVEIPNYHDFPQEELDEKCIAILDEIVKTCKEKDIQIIFFTTPYEGQYGYCNAMKEYAMENGCDYLNLFAEMDAIGLDCDNDFADYSHLNYYGATKIGDYLGTYILKHYKMK